ATTKAGLLSSPLRDRFGVTHKMDYYTEKEIMEIVERAAKVLGTTIDKESSKEIALRSRGTPRIANRFLKRIRDYCDIKGDGKIEKNLTLKGMKVLGIDKMGLDQLDREIIMSIIKNYGGGPVGIETLSLLLGEDKRTLEEVYEPYLVKTGYIKRTPRGRVVTEKALEHFEKE
ncbi:MAG: Holliday junction DNA helicase RuvB C-terminal domain-containing protein, partial [Fusobacteriaceae bacterium]